MRKIIFIVLALGLTLILVAGVTFAQEQRNIDNQYCYDNEYMIQIIRENGFEEIAVSMENRDRGEMMQLMRNLSDEDYSKMQNLMTKTTFARKPLTLVMGSVSENGYESQGMRRMSNRMLIGGYGSRNGCRQ